MHELRTNAQYEQDSDRDNTQSTSSSDDSTGMQVVGVLEETETMLQ